VTCCSLRAALRDLATAPTRVQRMIAVRRVERLLGDLVGVVATLVGDDTTDLCVVACGPLSGAPLHAVPNSTGQCWLDRWTVRYWPSAQVAATLRRPRRFESLTAVAVAGIEEDLPLASSELTAVAGPVARLEVPPATWRVDAWLRRALRGAGLAHFACHARGDLVDPTGSSFEFGIGGRPTVANLLEWDDVDDLDMVVASACQAGVPSSDAPDEYLGIGFGLLHTGAQSVISPLWEVNETRPRSSWLGSTASSPPDTNPRTRSAWRRPGLAMSTTPRSAPSQGPAHRMKQAGYPRASLPG